MSDSVCHGCECRGGAMGAARRRRAGTWGGAVGTILIGILGVPALAAGGAAEPLGEGIQPAGDPTGGSEGASGQTSAPGRQISSARGLLDLEAPPEPIDQTPSLPFGAKDTMMAVFGFGGAVDGQGSTDLEGWAQLTWFIVDDVELGGELGAWHFSQEGEDAAGGSVAALIRWHFVNENRLSLFLDGGLGLLGASDDVPAEGTELNFMPRAGVGATYRPWDGNLRLIIGARWHHISNARSSGAEDNPSRDGVMLYLGIGVPF